MLVGFQRHLASQTLETECRPLGLIQEGNFQCFLFVCFKNTDYRLLALEPYRFMCEHKVTSNCEFMLGGNLYLTFFDKARVCSLASYHYIVHMVML